MSLDRVSFKVVKSKTGVDSLVAILPDGSERVIHSLFDPVGEGKRFAERVSAQEDEIVLVLGVGMGYHVASLAERLPSNQIVAACPLVGMRELRREARLHQNFPDNVLLLEGLSPKDVVAKVLGVRVRKGMPAIKVFSYLPIRQIHPEFFEEVERLLGSGAKVNVRDKLTYPKFQSEKLTVLLLDFPYFVVREVKKAFMRLGHRVVSVPCTKGDSTSMVLQRVAKAVLEYRPDFLFSVNHLGFDEEGELTSFLESIGLPAAVWYVDSPEIIVSPHKGNVSEICTIFLWDYAYRRMMRRLGYREIQFLPLATDESVFSPKKGKRFTTGASVRVGFVGSSNRIDLKEAMEILSPSSREVIEECSRVLLRRFLAEEGSLYESVEKYFPDWAKKEIEGLCGIEKARFVESVLWKSSQIYRIQCFSALQGFDLVIRGDEGWKDLLNGGFSIEGPLSYYDELPAFYRSCCVNLNFTSLQMPSGANQRVFDVPACGGFLVTDYRESLWELFDVRKEVVVFRSVDELRDIVRYYLSHEKERELVSKRARERVYKEHTYTLRMRRICEVLKKTSAKLGV